MPTGTKLFDLFLVASAIAILAVVNFATLRWLALFKEEGRKPTGPTS